MSDLDLKAIAKLHTARGGEYSWIEIVKKFNLDIPPEALRKRVQRFEKAAVRRLNDDTYGADNSDWKHAAKVKTANTRDWDYINGDDVDVEYDVDADDVEGDPEDFNHEYMVEADDLTDDYTDPKMYAMQKEIETLRKMLANAGLDRNQDELMYDPYPPHLDDTEKWEKWQYDFPKKKDVITVMFWSDIHIPDHSSSALALSEKLLGILQPDVLIHGGDMFDFDALSTFAKSRRRRFRDAIDEVSDVWRNITYRVNKISPKTLQIAFRGNHDSRIERWNDMAANPFADTTEEAFVQMVRSDGRVLWLGQYQETHVDTLFVQHGKKVGENAAKAAVKDQGWGTSLVQGHNHRPALFVHRVNSKRNPANYQVVMGASAGALCNIPPHYQMDTKQTSWLHGIVTGHVNIPEETSNLQNVIFHKNAKTGKLWTSFGEHVVSE